MQDLPKPSKVSLLRSRSQRQIRAQFYDKLGLLGNKRPSPGTTKTTSERAESTVSQPLESSASLRSCMKQVRPVLQPRPRYNVSFCDYMQVHLIPSHRDYDRQTHADLWNSSRTIRSERKRNVFEFWTEGGDWRYATEEADMVRAHDGSLIHPATWAASLQLQAYYAQHNAYYEYNTEGELELPEEEEEKHKGEEEKVPEDDYEYNLSYECGYQTQPLPSYRSTVQARKRMSWEKPASRSVIGVGTDCYTRTSNVTALDKKRPHMASRQEMVLC